MLKTQFGLHCYNKNRQCRGRLINADLDVCMIHPILLPRSEHFNKDACMVLTE